MMQGSKPLDSGTPHPATVLLLRQVARLVKGIGSAIDEWVNTMEKPKQ